MKTIFLSIAFALFAFAGLAQTNPTVTGGSVSPDPIPGANPYATLEFIFANLDPDPISHLDPDGNPDPMVIKVSLQNGVYDDVHYADPVDAIGGSYADHFDWVYDANTKTYTGTQNQPVLGSDGGTVTIGYRATAATPQSNPNNGSTINLTSNGNAPNGPGTNDTNDDKTEAITYMQGPLPVTLTSFSVTKEGASALLNWATTAETNSDYFEIQHSVTGKEWAKVDRVASHGESTTLKNYTFTHSTPVNGENLYRLKMVDKDATFAYSRIQSVKFDGIGSDLSVYPNPVTDKLFIRDFSQVTQVKINDLNGRSVYQAAGSTTGEVDVKNLSTGIYVVNITRSNGIKSSQKIVISK